MTLAATHAHVASEYVIGDILAPLMDIWVHVQSSPNELANAYEQVWYEQLNQDAYYYNRIREQYNTSPQPALLLYLLTRCVKNAPRFNRQGHFNQSHDKRRLGMHPQKMRQELLQASVLLQRHTYIKQGDFTETLADATSDDIVYLDPPYEGTSTGSDRRYYQSLERDRLVELLATLNERQISFLLSYDGRCGTKTYGSALPESLHLTRLELHAGRSSQATLHGREDVTVESLYVSNNLQHS
jgi:DNA adenine methylase